MFRALLKRSKCLKTGNGLVGAICKNNFVQVRNILIAKKLVYLREMKIYLHTHYFIYPCSRLDGIVNKSCELKRKKCLRGLTAVDLEPRFASRRAEASRREELFLAPFFADSLRSPARKWRLQVTRANNTLSEPARRLLRGILIMP